MSLMASFFCIVIRNQNVHLPKRTEISYRTESYGKILHRNITTTAHTKRGLSSRLGGAVEYRLYLLRGVRPSYESPDYDTKKSDGEVPMMQEIWVMLKIPSLPSLPDSLFLGVVAPDRALSMGQIDLNCILMINRIF